MKRRSSIALASVIAPGVFLFSAARWHSLGENYYLKSFFPKRFSVQEAYFAGAVELVKVVIIGLTIVRVIAVAPYALGHAEKQVRSRAAAREET
jgi:hypothetical protein